MENALLSTFLPGLLYTVLFFALSFVSVLFVKLCVYYIRTAPKTKSSAAEKTAAAPKQDIASEEKIPAAAPAKKPMRIRRRVHNIEIRPDEINRIYVAEHR